MSDHDREPVALALREVLRLERINIEVVELGAFPGNTADHAHAAECHETLAAKLRRLTEGHVGWLAGAVEDRREAAALNAVRDVLAGDLENGRHQVHYLDDL